MMKEECSFNNYFNLFFITLCLRFSLNSVKWARRWLCRRRLRNSFLLFLEIIYSANETYSLLRLTLLLNNGIPNMLSTISCTSLIAARYASVKNGKVPKWVKNGESLMRFLFLKDIRDCLIIWIILSLNILEKESFFDHWIHDHHFLSQCTIMLCDVNRRNLFAEESNYSSLIFVLEPDLHRFAIDFALVLIFRSVRWDRIVSCLFKSYKFNFSGCTGFSSFCFLIAINFCE